jgi:hypothetical protein
MCTHARTFADVAPDPLAKVVRHAAVAVEPPVVLLVLHSIADTATRARRRRAGRVSSAPILRRRKVDGACTRRARGACLV